MAGTTAGWDAGRVTHAGGDDADAAAVLQRRFLAMLEGFRVDAAYPYREAVRRAVAADARLVALDASDVAAYDEGLAEALLRRPADVLPLAEEAVRVLARHLVPDAGSESLARLQVHLRAGTRPTPVRALDSSTLGSLVRVSGIVVSASAVSARPVAVCAVCRGCKTERFFFAAPGAVSVVLPRHCPGPAGGDARAARCPPEPFSVVPGRSRCVDAQTLRLQEAPEAVPVGEMPRQVLLVAERALAGRLVPGSRVVVTGVYAVLGGTASRATQREAGDAHRSAVRTAALRLLGYERASDDESASGNASPSAFGEGDAAALARSPGLYERFASSIAPSIFGHADVKRALAALLLGGSRKVLPDGVRLRGDVNVLLLGDPGVAKSQFLKFAARAAPIAVYTSGKGSSAAGLTASVVRDASTGEFYLEGGAFVLADGGVVCIDEFDKMDADDRVAIHEAMEQQTISVAKAGITTVLNARASVLAAANPVFGRYDESRTPGENIDFAATILSRFDLIFVLRDEHVHARDVALARHVLGVHQAASAASSAAADPDALSLATMRAYVAHARATVAPRLSAAAAETLAAHYVAMRSDVARWESAASARSTIPITVRQLEAVVRVSEALAKLSLSPVASEAHVEEALRLFRVSTMAAVASGQYSLEGMADTRVVAEAADAERAILARIPLGSSAPYRALVRDLVDGRRFSEAAVVRALDALVRSDVLLLRSQGKLLIRQEARSV